MKRIYSKMKRQDRAMAQREKKEVSDAERRRVWWR